MGSEYLPQFTGSFGCWLAFGIVLMIGGALYVAGWRQRAAILQVVGGVVLSVSMMWVSLPALAQTPGQIGSEAEALIRRAEERGKSAEGAVADWLKTTPQTNDRMTQEAAGLAAVNEGRIAQGLGMLQGDATVGDAAELSLIGNQPSQDGAIYIAVSLSMPKSSLRQLSADAEKAGAQMVVRGLVGGSWERTLDAAREVWGENATNGLVIEPQVFRAFEVERVPVFIVARDAVQPCQNGVNCISTAPAHDKISGNISLGAALEILAEKGNDAPDVARRARARMGSS